MTALDILDALRDLLRERWPERTYYTDYAPKDFRRPSFLVEAGPVEQTELGGAETGFAMEARITAFLPVDAYHHSDREELCRVMGEVMGLFGRGYFKAGERRPHVDKLRGEYGWDYAAVNLSISVFEPWGEGEEYPLCGKVHLRVKNQ